MVTIKILESCSGIGFSYHPKQVVEVSPERASDLVKHGIAEYMPPVKPETATLKPKGETRKK